MSDTGRICAEMVQVPSVPCAAVPYENARREAVVNACSGAVSFQSVHYAIRKGDPYVRWSP